jgi:hypothetical protein
LVPVREDGTCRFGAIDIDQEVDLAHLAAEVARRRLPLWVCRSKSGGAHLYAFFAEPGLKASKVREHLRRWAAVLGFPDAEIFPKQNIVGNGNLGNWINLPYFAGDRTLRYAVGAAGKALTLDEFLSSVMQFDETTYAGDETPPIGSDAMPPCLCHLSEEGLREGSRNNGLFNFGVFFRKSAPNNWVEKLDEVNRTKSFPPLGVRELGHIRQSLRKKDYGYRCSEPPIRDFCDRATCLKLQFGIGHKGPTEEYDPYTLAHLKKIETDPPRYSLEVNGRELELSQDQFLHFRDFKDTVAARLDLFIAPLTQARWDMVLRELVRTMERLPAPPEASPSGEVLDMLDDFLGYCVHCRTMDDIGRGLPYYKIDEEKQVNEFWFRSRDFQRHVMARKPSFKGNLWSLLRRERGARSQVATISKKSVRCWVIDASRVDVLTENPTPEEEIGPESEVGPKKEVAFP